MDLGNGAFVRVWEEGEVSWREVKGLGGQDWCRKWTASWALDVVVSS